MKWTKENYNSVIITVAATILALCALLGGSYLMGSFIIEKQDIKTENISLTEIRTTIGYVVLCVLYSGARLVDFICWVWKKVREVNHENTNK